MSDQPDDLTAFTRALAEVAPHPGGFDRDALLFAAGRAAVPRRLFWPVLTVILALLSASLTVAFVTRPPRVVEVERIVYVSVPADPVARDVPVEEHTPAPPPLPPEWVEGLRRRQRLVDEDPGPLPTTAWTPSGSHDLPDLLDLRLNHSPSRRGRLQ
jgi:hypothetical protein